MADRKRWVLAAAIGLLALGDACAERVRVVDEGGLRGAWSLREGAALEAPAYPAEFAARGDNVCLAIGYAVRPDGTTSDFSLLKAWNSASDDDEPEPGYWDAFAQAGAAAVSKWKFQPKQVRPDAATYTVATLHFMGRQAVDVAGLTSHCKISDLAGFIQRQKADRFFAGLDKHEMERLQRLQDRQQQAAAAAAALRRVQQQNPPPPPPPTP
ncbi:hypothetical protein FCE95_11770 [Luteimonas gilva]|uniref:TonB C-terminal domain-containing protein n=1 Tax=Luteimonas gilva TaxID=2572684 RepID=A0A4U5JM79_9GAMM|nr:hypothetical protein [Luteimonas gilva]TKR30770.1 hypothetical protein FCE95_11770 [Luteimonas gilva]